LFETGREKNKSREKYERISSSMKTTDYEWKKFTFCFLWLKCVFCELCFQWIILSKKCALCELCFLWIVLSVLSYFSRDLFFSRPVSNKSCNIMFMYMCYKHIVNKVKGLIYSTFYSRPAFTKKIYKCDILCQI
jgi:hypothetical protein